MLLESKTLLSSNISHTKLINFPKIRNVVQTYSFIPGGSNFFDALFPFLAFFNKIKILWEKFGHVTPVAKGLLCCRPLRVPWGVHNVVACCAMLANVCKRSQQVTTCWVFTREYKGLWDVFHLRRYLNSCSHVYVWICGM